ncbi:glycoside hydrolase/phage tail family protein [Labrenzia sp. CE80]|uniref:baseplate multidomain protein megatron n=1 Tax=Labrenzia sp. CE80 TaxID=1788986 RepID=UPI00129A6FAD|nr:glycoside hydrolase/phage tail family protein [Labrenzia sp. CE80]
MATLVLGAAATAFSGAIGAGTFTSALISGAATVAGAYADNLLVSALSPTQRQSVEGPKISDLRLQTSTEGAALPDVFGRVRIAGQVIWATRLRMEVSTSTETVGGKGLGGGQKVSTTTYQYFANFAVGLSEGPIIGIGRVWADGKLLDLTGITYRVHVGSEDQQPDPLIETKEGSAPAYRGTAYVVFEDLSLEGFGNRIPQLEFEVFRRVGQSVEDEIQGMVVIPGAGEWVYATEPVRKTSEDTEGSTTPENVNNQIGGTDWSVAIDDLERTCPNAKSVLLVVAWFGTDLRCGSCQIRPGVEFGDEKTNEPLSWSVHGETRDTAYVVSRDAGDDDRPAYGGTPSDQSVVQAIRDLRARGIDVVLYPFILMDIPDGNGLPDPYGDAEQAVLPWRGRITCHPAPGQPGTVDKTAAAGTQVNALFGSVAANQISISINSDSGAVSTSYSGPSEWSLRRMVLHYARLCAALNAEEAGTVSGFVMASELRGLTTVQSSANSFPAVDQLVTLAADCRSVLGSSVSLTYAADWSEYRGFEAGDGSGDFYFHLDPLWASSDIDAVAIDNYMKLSDWRDGTTHLDALDGWFSIHDPEYLKSNVEGAEDYDWYYASEADRTNQVRTDITDGTGKPWVYRAKDFRNWWLNQHNDRPGGVESGSPTSWLPQSKPIWFTEYGFPSVDKATNQPNVFVDPKSSESAWPYFSNRQRSDAIQRRGIETVLRYWDPEEGNNPVSGIYGERMLDLSRSFLWTWDARPYPAWPYQSEVWGDGDNWPLGHWVQGKFGAVDLAELVAYICASVGFTDIDVSQLQGVVTGWQRASITTPRAQLQTLAQLYRFDAVESEGLIRFVPRGGATKATIIEQDLAAPDRKQADWSMTRAQETDLPVRASLAYFDAESDYRQTSSNAGRLTGSSERIESVSAPAVIETAEAEGMVEAWLLERWVGREQASFALPPSMIRLDPTDTVALEAGGRSRDLRLSRIIDAGARQCEAVAVERSVYSIQRGTSRPVSPGTVPSYGPAVLEVLDLPVIEETQVEHRPWLAATASPWAGVRVLEGSRAVGSVIAPATLGMTTTDLASGTTFRFDRANSLTVKLAYGTLASRSEDELLEGTANALAIRNADGDWEILQFATADLVASQTWQLSGLLRGRRGTEHAMRDPVAAGARVVLLDGALTQADVPLSDRGIERSWSYGPAPAASTDSSFKTRLNTFEAVALKPFAPVHLAGTRNLAGDLAINWIRSARRNGSWLDGTDVPLVEAGELYELEILGGGPVIRTVSGLTSPAHNYTAADQIADFGSVQSSIHIRVFQISDSIGRGIPAEATL